MNFKNPYNQNEDQNFLSTFLSDFEKDTEEISISKNCKFISAITKIGRSKDLNLNIYEIEHNGENDPRVSLSKEAFSLMKEYAVKRSLIFFKNPKTENYRLSLITFQSSWDSGKKIKTEFSNPRRYSFFLGPEAKTKTPENFLVKKGVVKDFEDLLSRFSVEVVNKEFYKEIAKFFRRLVGGDIKLGSKPEHFEPEMILPSVDKSDKKTYQEFAVRLIGRIIFCWFLKQKKSSEGISLLPDEFLSKEAVIKNPEYYHNVLEKIFFQVLNRPISQRNSELTNGYGKIPYLNGGLFDPHHDDYYENQPNWALKIPDDWFLKLFEILETYNFTIDENTVLDVDLSIDPEMLGRIFENLLAEINPETGESARKTTGSYYTPRPIVEYMVDQSLIQYLLTKTGVNEEKLKALISIDEADDEIYPLSHEEKQHVVNALDEVKIIDPACGSGAFPIGILQKIVFVLGRIDQNGQLWFEKKTENLDPLLKEDFNKKFANENFDYIRKTGVIRGSIYGVDIQPIAVEVSKLRCFLTLIVDEDIDEDAENRGIKPLPNLEFKFVAANTLINLPGETSNGGQTGMFEDSSEIEQLKKLRDQYFVSNGYDKERIKSKFKDIQREMFKKQIDKGGHGKMTMALADWDPFKDTASNWFDPEWMFGVKKFAIAIANPPYIFARESKNKGFTKETKEYFYKNYQLAKYQLNLYSLFIERGDKLLNQQGVLSYITPNNWLTINTNFALRKFILDRFNISIVNFYARVFKSASVDSAVLVYQKNGENKISLYDFIDDFVLVKESKKDLFLQQKDLIINIQVLKNSEMFSIISRIESQSQELSKIADVKVGLKAYQIGKGKPLQDEKIKTCRAFHSKNKVNDNYYKYLEGRDVGRYQLTWSGEYLQYGKHLAEPRNNFDLFSSKRILVRQIPSRPPYCINACLVDDTFLNDLNSMNIINIKVKPEYILGLLNSKLMSYWFINKFGKLQRGIFPQFKVNELASFPIKIAGADIQEKIGNLVNEIIKRKQNDRNFDISDLNTMIDSEVYRIYDLTPEEIKIVEGKND